MANRIICSYLCNYGDIINKHVVSLKSKNVPCRKCPLNFYILYALKSQTSYLEIIKDSHIVFNSFPKVHKKKYIIVFIDIRLKQRTQMR